MSATTTNTVSNAKASPMRGVSTSKTLKFVTTKNERPTTNSGGALATFLANQEMGKKLRERLLRVD